jgi:TP901 family phage tail tape measure protein
MAGHRTVEVVLTAQVNGFLAGMRLAEQEARRAAAGADGARVKFEAQQKAMEVGGKTALAFGAASAAGIALVVKASAEYGAKMAQLRTLSGATTGTMKQLSDAAMQQGQAFGQSALQVADAEIELQKAGRSTAQILGGDLKGALALAAAGQLDVGKATQIGVTALTQFSKQGPSISHVADLLAAGSDKALGSVEDLGMALNQSGLVASQMGVSLEETTGTLAAFAQNGLIGSDAGTSFKTMLLSLQSPSQQAAEQLAKYNIHAYDAEGHFVGMAQLAGQLQNGFKDASQAEKDFAMSTIFGTDAIRAANVLFDEGSAGIRKWTKDVDAQGFAAIQAAGKMDSLQGDMTKLSAAFETGLIKAGTSADGGFRGIVQGATNVVEVVSGIPGPVQGAAVGLTALGAAGAIVGGAALLAVPKIAAMRAELTRLGVSGKGAAGIVGKGAGLTVGILALGSALAGAGERATGGAADVAQALNRIKTAGAGVKDSDFGGDFMNQTRGFKDALEKSFGNDGWESSFAHGVSTITKLVGIDLASGFEKNERQLNAYGQALSSVAEDHLPEATRSFRELVKQAGGGQHAVQMLAAAMPDYREKITQLLTAQKIQATEQNVQNAMQGKGAAGARILAAATDAARTAAENQAKGLADLSGTATAAKGDIDDLANAIEGFGSTTLDARAAQAAMQEAIAKATKEIGKNGKGIDLHTKAGRENDSMLRDLASSTAAAAGKTLKMTGSAKDAENQMREGRKAFIVAAAAAGIVGDKAQLLADKYGLIPKNVKTAVGVTGYDEAVHKVGTVLSHLRGLDGKSATVAVHYEADGSAFQVHTSGGRPLVLRAEGGEVDGPGPKGVDSVFAKLAPGEHVWTDREVDAVGGQAAMYRLRAAALSGDLPAFAAGGASGGSRSTSGTTGRGGAGRTRTRPRSHSTSVGSTTRPASRAGRPRGCRP